MKNGRREKYCLMLAVGIVGFVFILSRLMEVDLGTSQKTIKAVDSANTAGIARNMVGSQPDTEQKASSHELKKAKEESEILKGHIVRKPSELREIYDELQYTPDRNLSFKIDTMTYTGYLNFLPALKESDQKYRRMLKGRGDHPVSDDTRRIENIMKQNDRQNQKILLALLKKFGWPCGTDRSSSFYAWLVIWHADIIEKKAFHPFLKEGFSNGCMLKAHYDHFGI